MREKDQWRRTADERARQISELEAEVERLQGIDYEARCMRLEAEVERLKADPCAAAGHHVCGPQGAEAKIEAALAQLTLEYLSPKGEISQGAKERIEQALTGGRE